MFRKNKRILWLLNHRTLMPFEVPLMHQLGFEVFIPKIIPKTGFRSGAVDFSYDPMLSLPPKILRRLNEFDFYKELWPADIVAIVNRYFGTAFITANFLQASEAIDNFEGQIVFRAFGLENENSYTNVFSHLYGPLIHRKIEGIKHRFWFGEGYDNLHECENPIFAERALFLPIGIPKSLFSSAGQWNGSEGKILFVCPNATTNAYYSEIYKKFKSELGDLPHVIVGAQDVPVDDPNVLGFVSDEELRDLYLNCALLYYPSVEVRHVHYSPVEAAINGMPVIFFADSLLDRLSQNSTKGRVSSSAEARRLIERMLADDRTLIAEMKAAQQDIAYHFSEEYCRAMWARQMEERGFFKAFQEKSRIEIRLIELWRTMLKPFARGRLKVNPHRRAVKPTYTDLTAEEAEHKYGSSLFDGISFAQPTLPAVIDYVDGVAGYEYWGRWSNDKKIVIVLKHLLQGKFRLYLHAVGYGENAGAPVPVRIGAQIRTVRLQAGLGESRGLWLHFDLERPSNVIEITVPHPVRPEMDSRTVGIGIVKIGAAPPVALSLEEAKHSLGSTLADGMDFSAPELPAFIDSVQGLCEHEHWGRWSGADRVVFELKHTLQGAFRLLLRGVGFGANAGVPIGVRIGDQTCRMRLGSQPGANVVLEFDLTTPSNVIEIEVPNPTSSQRDPRRIGIGFYEMRVSVMNR